MRMLMSVAWQICQYGQSYQSTTLIKMDYFHRPFLPPISKLGRISLPVRVGTRYRSSNPSFPTFSSPSILPTNSNPFPPSTTFSIPPHSDFILTNSSFLNVSWLALFLWMTKSTVSNLKGFSNSFLMKLYRLMMHLK